MHGCARKVLFDSAYRNAHDLGYIGLTHAFHPVQHERLTSFLSELQEHIDHLLEFLLTAGNAFGTKAITDHRYRLIVPSDTCTMRYETPAAISPPIQGNAKHIAVLPTGRQRVRMRERPHHDVLRKVFGLGYIATTTLEKRHERRP
jgi:hypothetical protein